MAPRKPVRTLFVYGVCLRKGDITRVTDSLPQPGGGWEMRTTEGEVVKVDTKTKKLYSRTIIVIRDKTSGERRECTISNESYMPLIGAKL